MRKLKVIRKNLLSWSNSKFLEIIYKKMCSSLRIKGLTLFYFTQVFSLGNCLYDCMTKKRNNQNFEACHIEFFLLAYFCELWMNLLNAKSVLLGVTSLWWFLLDKDDWSHKNKHSLYKILQPSSKSCFILKPTLHYFSYCFLAFVAEKKSFICSAFALPTTVARDWNKMYIIY